jgi:hypothetical protein
VPVSFKFLEAELVGTTVPRPLSGTLSGHAAGEPFDKHAFKFIQKRYPGKTYRQFELLNKLYSQNPQALGVPNRWALVKPAALAYLLNRGTDATKNWSLENQFVEKQNDTADIIVLDKPIHIIDIKTYNSSMKGQPPNIISAYKLAKMCLMMINDETFNTHDVTYVGVVWKLDGENLVCSQAVVKELFKINPVSLYINWAAAMQIQFHVHEVDQAYTGSVEAWCRSYIEHFASMAELRVKVMTKKFVDPFIEVLE